MHKRETVGGDERKKSFLEGVLMYFGFYFIYFSKIIHVHSFKKNQILQDLYFCFLGFFLGLQGSGSCAY
jgi:hypothetical protein